MRLPSSKSQVVISVHLRPSLIWWCARCLTRPPQEFADSASAVALLQRQHPAAPSTPQHQASSARKAPTRATDDQATDHERIRTRSRLTSQTHFYPATGPGAPALALRPRSASLLRPPGCRQCTECCRVVCCEKQGGRGQQRRGLADRGSQQQQQQQQQQQPARAARTCVQWVPVPSTGKLCEAAEGRGTQCLAWPLGRTGRSGAQGPWGG